MLVQACSFFSTGITIHIVEEINYVIWPKEKTIIGTVNLDVNKFNHNPVIYILFFFCSCQFFCLSSQFLSLWVWQKEQDAIESNRLSNVSLVKLNFCFRPGIDIILYSRNTSVHNLKGEHTRCLNAVPFLVIGRFGHASPRGEIIWVVFYNETSAVWLRCCTEIVCTIASSLK